MLIREIETQDNAAMARIIRQVMPEFGAQGPGFAINDPEVDHMAQAYAIARHRYFVVEENGTVQGGAGIAPLTGLETTHCELRKMYFLPSLRGRGIGSAMMERCLAFAREAGYAQCYLETLTGMDEAQALYRRFGFQAISGALGATGHFGCNRFFLLAL